MSASRTSLQTAQPLGYTREDVEQARSSLKRRFYFGLVVVLIAGAAVAGGYWYAQRLKDLEASKQGKTAAPPAVQDVPTSPESPPAPPPNAIPEEEALVLAHTLKSAGMRLYGQTTCPYTKLQRELFGSGQARSVLESIYVECRTSQDCPNMRAVPTWAYGDNRFPGYKNAQQLTALLDQAKLAVDSRMLQQPSVPVTTDNLPKAEHAEPDAKLPSAEAARAAPHNIAAAAVAADAATVEDVTDKEAAKKEESGAKKPKENMRGVVASAPLNVPNLPGTKVWELPMERHEYNASQGLGMPTPTPPREGVFGDLRRQMQIARDTAAARGREGDPASDAISETRTPDQGVKITLGEPFEDPTVGRQS